MVKDKFKKKKVLVCGDFLLDVYTFGDVERISPEAPVPVLHVTGEKRLPGGAGNAALNLISLGMEVVALGRMGDDVGGSQLANTLHEEGVDIRGIFSDPSFQTPLKNRMIASGQQIVRVDYEHPCCLTPSLLKHIEEELPHLLNDIDIVSVSDYAKGFLTPPFLRLLIDSARKKDIPIVIDPKGLDFTRYRGATLLKPNLSEARLAAGLGREASLDEIACKILKDTEIETLLVTRSKEGMSVFNSNNARRDFPPMRPLEVKDVTGAGDTVHAVITAAIANNIHLDEAAYFASAAASLAIEQVGCMRISLSQIEARLQLIHSA